MITQKHPSFAYIPLLFCDWCKKHPCKTKFWQEPITRSLHTNCTLESTLSRIFLFLELMYVGEGGFFNFPRKHADVPRFSQLLKYFRAPCLRRNNRGPQLSYDWLLCKHPRKTPWEVPLKNKKIRDRVDSEGQYGRWKLWVMGSWFWPFLFFQLSPPPCCINLYTLTSICRFSMLFAIHFLRGWQGEFV